MNKTNFSSISTFSKVFTIFVSGESRIQGNNRMKNESMHKLMVVTAFSVAMGYLECAVVVYLREIYYPGGFDFPVQIADPQIGLTEALREVATLLMLATAGMMAGRKAMERFGWFLYSFAVWDIFYYVFLKLLLGWPPSLLTWDLLFLIPLVWAGPVVAPVINSLSMILLGIVLVRFTGLRGRALVSRSAWVLLFTGGFTVLSSYIYDFLWYTAERLAVGPVNQEKIKAIIMSYVPSWFNWWLFSAGQLLILLGIVVVYTVNKRNKPVFPEEMKGF
jgi:hypothetical protein